MSEIPYVVITGPTGSGKTDLAFGLASTLMKKGGGAVIINGDSMQLYAHMHILTARPREEERKSIIGVPYLLDGVLKDNARASAGWWLKNAVTAIHDAWTKKSIPIVVGGTGLYLKALMEGIAPIPEIPVEITEKVRSLKTLPLPEIIKTIENDFPHVIDYNDPQRLLRAFEVFLATGKSMKDFFGQEKRPLSIDPFLVVLNPERQTLYEHLDSRFLAMMQQGALEEVDAFIKLQHPLDHPLYKATGVMPLMQYLKGQLRKEAAITLAQQHTRQYAKRQRTWMANQFSPNLILDPFEKSLEESVTQLLHTLKKVHPLCFD